MSLHSPRGGDGVGVGGYFNRSTFELIQIKQNEIFSSSVALATVQVLKGCLWVVATTPDRPDTPHVHRHQQIYRRALAERGESS